MYAQLEKPKGNKSRAVANPVGQKKGNRKQGVGIVDNRPVQFFSVERADISIQNHRGQMIKQGNDATSHLRNDCLNCNVGVKISKLSANERGMANNRNSEVGIMQRAKASLSINGGKTQNFNAELKTKKPYHAERQAWREARKNC